MEPDLAQDVGQEKVPSAVWEDLQSHYQQQRQPEGLVHICVAQQGRPVAGWPIGSKFLDYNNWI